MESGFPSGNTSKHSNGEDWPVWKALAEPDPGLTVAPERLFADLLVIGESLAGLSAALHAARLGLDVVLLETAAPGAPALAIPDAFVHSPHWPERGHGELNLVQPDAPGELFAFLAREDIEAAPRRGGVIHAVSGQEQLAVTGEQVRRWRAAGANIRLLNDADIVFLTGAWGWTGGWLEEDGGTLDPVSLQAGLRHLCHQAGVRFHLLPVLSALESREGGLQASHAAGRIDAAFMLLADSRLSPALVPELAKSLVPARLDELASLPLSRELQGEILPFGHAAVDEIGAFHFLKGPGGHLMASALYRGRRARQQKTSLEQRLYAASPLLKTGDILYRRVSRLLATADGVPRLYQPRERFFALAGWEEAGAALSFRLGRRLAEAFAGTGNLDLPVDLLRPVSLWRRWRLPWFG
ncbi:NAD(P)/FAD-dependent oxidoreductase [Rhizobium paknamense]|uniref:Glycine/D-amino acid oxidase-like deaminating enzyme n=1 Tax=Rhizobium paknamense TaxID=1206817 RepID=A0ABU0IFT3_9HYPH|nr:FAD-binding oxidoreductase [Rhizobium paknamense]MDQ0457099.1 glycine/D-amino acid oxidase-like deaminating enzyme [Rhizobium paknamense]